MFAGFIVCKRRGFFKQWRAPVLFYIFKKTSYLVQQVFLEVRMDGVVSETESSRNILKECFSLPYFEFSAFASMQTVSNKAGNRERAWLCFFFSKAH